MSDGWRRREQQDLLEERRVLAWLCAVFGTLTVGGFLVASIAALLVGAIGATIVIGRLRSLRVAERLLSGD
jgi:type III secretory pathway component EscV